ncbi:diguanylate cyclase [Mycobacterium sp. shizuoka-1]|uniref:GGDEF domain-containing protein n=1 Tax=Mycobacterium sp. shizuoka-1 TaxID=2039281 RepID=UPI000C061F37|nr:GGDEF domain-containing protein [Mycobacterium sp. shizuoka-1]GAY13980.1 hypothetical protein MSZK_07060 [Mycobacterium sp. shizuoka-1]
MNDERASWQGGQAGGRIARWWRQPDQFDWLTEYLRARGLGTPTRILMAIASGALTLMAVAALTSHDLPPAVKVAFSVASVLTGVGYAAVWVRGWPTRRQSVAMAWLGGALVAAGCVMQPQPVVALLGCTGVAILGGYAAFMHNTKAIAVVVVIGVAAGAACAARMVATEGWVIAVAGLWLVVELNLAVPLAIQAVIRTLGTDVVRSDQDPLTGVLNRRAFYQRAKTLFTSPADDLHLVVVMIDLDKFKTLNDLYGHLAGDQALTAVGWVLREASNSTAIIGRFGGEEFIVVDAVSADAAERLPTQLCAAIAALPHPVTASVGAAVVRWGCGSAVDDLIRSADAAMYAAKRAGGNQTRICRPVRVGG